MSPEDRAQWDVNPELWPHTPPYHVFRELFEEDEHLWWRMSFGHGLNAYEAALERIDELEARDEDHS